MDDPLLVKRKKSVKACSNQPAQKRLKIVKHVGKEPKEQNVGQPPIPNKARRYQNEILKQALTENTIAYLDTGSGKTFIAVLILRELRHKLRSESNKKIAIFLAPTVHLVIQQGDVLLINTDLKVGVYYGDKGVDSWSKEKWKSELDNHEVFVMTPQVFLDALGSSALKMGIVEIIFMDECHHAQKRHPYAQIMKNHYHSNESEGKPKIFAMTASPVQQKGVASSADCAEQIRKLEVMLDAKVYTLKDKTELREFVPIPLQRTRTYRSSGSFFESLRQNLSILRDKFIGPDKECCEEFEDLEKIKERARKEIKNLHNALDYCIIELGTWCALEAARFLLKEEEDEIDCVQKSRNPFLEEVIKLLEAEIPSSMEEFGEETKLLSALKHGVITPKVYSLLQELMQFSSKRKEALRCIVFVERVVVSVVLSRLVNHMEYMPHVRCDYMAGFNAEHRPKNSKQQHHTTQMFRKGEVNVLVATSVAEEGLDIESCSCVIRFDLSYTVRGYIQSRGRARQNGSEYILFVERGNKKHEDLVFEMVKSEKSMREQAENRTNMRLTVNIGANDIQEKYTVESTGATVFSSSSVNFLYRYCSKLPGDRFYIPRPEFAIERSEKDGDLFQCTVYFPPNAPIRMVTGSPSRNKQLAKESACMACCTQLHSIGAISDELHPILEDETAFNFGPKDRSGSGTNKRKELHPSVKPSAFKGSWINSSGASLQAYQLTFVSENPDDGRYCNFAIVIDTLLDVDVANIEVDLCLAIDKMVKAKLTHLGAVHFDENELSTAKTFHEVLFNATFGKMFFRRSDEHKEVNIKCLLRWEEKLKKLWVESNLYLLLPLIGNGHYEIDWNAVKSFAMAGKLFKDVSYNELAKSSSFRENKTTLETVAGPVDISQFEDCVIITIHAGKVYCVVGVSDQDASSEFPNDSPYSTYAEYYKQRYSRVLKFPKQPLLMVKQTHGLHNLLVKSMRKEDKDGKPGKKNSSGKLGIVLIPAELCLVLGGLDSSIIRSLYLVPSFIHRLSAVICASELRNEIKKTIDPFPHVLAPRIMEALTTLRCLEGFSFEGLELLGDSYLKYAVSQYLFLAFENNHEGQLSAKRSHAVCNATLHKLALSRGLAKFIRDEVFQPSLWVAPGMYARRLVECRCKMSNLVEQVVDEYKGTEDTEVVKIGKTCSRGHRWICSKTIADVVEALIGVFFVEGGSQCALDFMSWIGIQCNFDASLLHAAQSRACMPPNNVQSMLPTVESLESILNYSFKNKSLLIEAITHASMQGSVCYQRLEFLGDATLDFLITKHLFESHPGLTPGILTELRQAAVNNGCFARVAVKYHLQRYLLHKSGELLEQVTKFVKKTQSEGHNNPSFGWEGTSPPKVLGDIVESIVGAVLIDTSFSLEEVWRVVKPMLSPLVTPETLPFHPVKEVQEICDFHKFPLEWEKVERDGKIISFKAKSQIDGEEVLGSSEAKKKKQARKEAAKKLVEIFQDRGFMHPRNKTKLDPVNTTQVEVLLFRESNNYLETQQGSKDWSQNGYSSDELNSFGSPEEITEGMDISQNEHSRDDFYDSGESVMCSEDDETCARPSDKIKEVIHSADEELSLGDSSISEIGTGMSSDVAMQDGSDELDQEPECIAVGDSSRMSAMLEPVKGLLESHGKRSTNSFKEIRIGTSTDTTVLAKGKAITSLYEFCKKQNWKEPTFEMEECGGLSHRRWFSMSVVVYILDKESIKEVSLQMPDKKKAKDNAATKMLTRLREMGYE